MLYYNKLYRLKYAYKVKKLKDPKNKTSYRTISVPPDLSDKLKDLKGNDEKWLFIRKNTRHEGMTNEEVLIKGSLTQSGIARGLHRIAKKAGLKDWRDLHPHSLRHAHVAYLAYKGIDWQTISKRLGHSNLATTLNVYAYLIDELRNKETAKINSALGGLSNPGPVGKGQDKLNNKK